MTTSRATQRSVIPAKAGIHIPEVGAWGTMGPRFRGDDGRSED